MKKIIIFLAVFLTAFGFAFAQPDNAEVQQALKTYTHKEDSLAAVFVVNRSLVQTSFLNFTDLQRTYLNKRFIAATTKAEAVLYEIASEPAYAKKHRQYSEKYLAQAEAFRKQKHLFFSEKEDAYITLWCDLMAYHGLVSNLRLLLEDKEEGT